ncbi:MAG: 4Fe-4S dicluster domain-containing protein [Nitrospirae bacterium]|nr:MAG: 4Fe-4S dicluster domain-containing protein [Nitrospirota bacterium]
MGAGLASLVWLAARPDNLAGTPAGRRLQQGKPSSLPRYGMLIDLDRCIGCQSCTVSCKTENNIPPGYFRTWVKSVEKGRFPHVSRHYLPRLCNHCERPPCVDVCPVLATYKRPDGAVVIDEDRCIGCGYCVQACPYDARFINPETHRADKCTFCIHRVEAGYEPACVTTCIGGARIFGDLNDPNSHIAQRIATEPTQVLRPDFGTEPRVYYIGLDQHTEGRIEERP